MRWFKHLTQAHDDQKISAILYEKNGLELYGLYWLILEMVALEYGEEGKTFVEFPARKLANIAGISPKKFQKMTETLSNINLFTVEFSNNFVKLDVPNIKKFRDEYSRKKAKKDEDEKDENVRTISGQSTEQLRHQIKIKKQIKKTETELNLNSDVVDFFQFYTCSKAIPDNSEITIIEEILDKYPLSEWRPVLKNMRNMFDLGKAKIPPLKFWLTHYLTYVNPHMSSMKNFGSKQSD
ncbi:MAG: hypothetical protein GWP19_00630 [Planctomycetia bacterium]|nr:hypothetical protein [Planctomycetia bacterium]